MGFRLGLRRRVAIAFALLGVVVSLALGMFVRLSSSELEQRLVDEALLAELEDYRQRLNRNPESLPPMTTFVRGYRVRAGEAGADLPAELAGLGEGRHAVTILGQPFRVAVSRGPDFTLYMLHSRAQLEYREQRLTLIVLLGMLFTGVLSAAGGWWLADRVISPVRELARRVRERQPSDLDTPLADGLPGDDVGELARAFERYLARTRAFVERERNFAADASHELRTPLSVIQGAVEVLQADPALDPKTRPRLERIARAARGMADLTTALLMLARERPGDAPAPAPIAVAEVLREVVEQHRGLLRHKPVELTLEVAAEPRVAVERPLLAIAIGNLVRNAFAYTEEGSVALTLAADSLTVRDTGPGVPPGDLCCLFEHSDRSRRATRGAGIGLPLVKRIADRQGWQVGVRSEAGQGAEFRLLFGTSLA